MYNIILFDFDGTVFDTVDGITKATRFALNRHGMDAELESLRCFAGPPLEESFMRVFGVGKEEALTLIADFRKYYLERGIYESRPFPGISHLLEKLKSSGKKLAITTLKPQFMAEILISKAGIDKYFDCICGTHTEGATLTKAELIRKAVENLGGRFEDCIMIGDTKYDVSGAHEAGVQVVGVRYGYGAESELESAGADIIVDTIHQLDELLAGI